MHLPSSQCYGKSTLDHSVLSICLLSMSNLCTGVTWSVYVWVSPGADPDTGNPEQVILGNSSRELEKWDQEVKEGNKGCAIKIFTNVDNWSLIPLGNKGTQCKGCHRVVSLEGWESCYIYPPITFSHWFKADFWGHSLLFHKKGP